MKSLGDIHGHKYTLNLRYDEMMKEEKQLNIDLESFEKKMQSWTSSSAAISSHSKTKQQDEKKITSVPPEVKAFQVPFHMLYLC